VVKALSYIAGGIAAAGGRPGMVGGYMLWSYIMIGSREEGQAGQQGPGCRKYGNNRIRYKKGQQIKILLKYQKFRKIILP